MLYSKSAEYALQAMIYLAENEGKDLAMVSSIAETYDIPKHFLAKLVQTLTHHHLIRSYRGAMGVSSWPVLLIKSLCCRWLTLLKGHPLSMRCVSSGWISVRTAFVAPCITNGSGSKSWCRKRSNTKR